MGRGVKRDIAKSYYYAVLADRFYRQARERSRLTALKRRIQRTVAAKGIDRAAIEKRAAAFKAKPVPQFPPPPPKPYEPKIGAGSGVTARALPSTNPTPPAPGTI